MDGSSSSSSRSIDLAPRLPENELEDRAKTSAVAQILRDYGVRFGDFERTADRRISTSVDAASYTGAVGRGLLARLVALGVNQSEDSTPSGRLRLLMPASRPRWRLLGLARRVRAPALVAAVALGALAALMRGGAFGGAGS